MNRLLIISLLVFITSTWSLSWLYLGKKSEVSELIAQNESLHQSLFYAEKAIKQQTSVCEIQDSLATEFQKESEQQEQVTKKIVNQISEMRDTYQKVEKNVKQETHSASLDDRLPDDLVRVLDEAYYTATDSTNHTGDNTRQSSD